MSIGMQIDLKTSQKLWKEILIGQSYKLILAPLIVYVLMWHILHIDGVVGRVCVLGAAIGSMNAMSILTAEKGLNPELSIIMPALGIPISIPLLFIIEYLIP
jgi:predicted permease